jgi:hypothetical protein
LTARESFRTLIDVEGRTMRAWVLLAAAGVLGCAAGYAEPDGARDGTLDAPIDDAAGRDDAAGEIPAEGGEDAGSETALDDGAAPEADVVPDAVPEVVPDAPADVEPEVPLPVSCELTGEFDCSAGPGGTGRCPDGPNVFGGQVNAAIDATIAEHPEWFVADGYAACCPLVRPENVNDYLQAVVDHLSAAGLCPSEPAEEFGLKFNNECSEAWDILANPDAETNLVRRHYVGNCFPSFF